MESVPTAKSSAKYVTSICLGLLAITRSSWIVPSPSPYDPNQL